MVQRTALSKEVVDPGLVNGDKISTDGLKMAPKAGGKYETNKGNRTTADAGTYTDDLAFSGGGIVHEDGTTEASGNYKVTIKGDIIVNKADLTVTTKDVTTPFGTVKFNTSGVQGLTNGGRKERIRPEVQLRVLRERLPGQQFLHQRSRAV